MRSAVRLHTAEAGSRSAQMLQHVLDVVSTSAAVISGFIIVQFKLLVPLKSA